MLYISALYRHPGHNARTSTFSYWVERVRSFKQLQLFSNLLKCTFKWFVCIHYKFDPVLNPSFSNFYSPLFWRLRVYSHTTASVKLHIGMVFLPVLEWWQLLLCAHMFEMESFHALWPREHNTLIIVLWHKAKSLNFVPSFFSLWEIKNGQCNLQSSLISAQL